MQPNGRRRASIAGLLAFIAAVAVVTAWFHEESRWDSRWAVVTLGGFALAAAIVTLGSRSLSDASIRLTVGAAVLLVSVAFTRIHAFQAGWHYRSVFHWAVYWALATVVLPMLLGPGLRRWWAAAGRERWVERLRQVPAGFLLFLLAIFLSLAIELVLRVMAPPAPPPPVLRLKARQRGAAAASTHFLRFSTDLSRRERSAEPGKRNGDETGTGTQLDSTTCRVPLDSTTGPAGPTYCLAQNPYPVR